MIRLFFFLIALLFLSGKPIEKKNSCLEIDILLLADLSTSVSGQENFIQKALLAFVNRFELSDQTMRMGYIRFSNAASLDVPLTAEKELLVNEISKINFSASGSTNLTNAFELTVNEFSHHGRPHINKMVIVITDGDPDDEETAMQYANLLKTVPGLAICGVYVDVEDGKSAYLKELSSEFCYVESNFENLVKELEKLDICL